MKLVDGGLRAFNDFMSSGPAFWWYVAGMLVVCPPVVLARALLAGRVLVHVGTLRRGLSFRLAGIEFLITPTIFPFGRGGACLYEGRPRRREAAVISLAGPAATVVGFLVAAAVLPHTGGIIRTLTWLAVLQQRFGAVLNLIPFVLSDRRGRTTFVSDGMSALRALRAG